MSTLMRRRPGEGGEPSLCSCRLVSDLHRHVRAAAFAESMAGGVRSHVHLAAVAGAGAVVAHAIAGRVGLSCVGLHDVAIPPLVVLHLLGVLRKPTWRG